jgi:hypothetical protein
MTAVRIQVSTTYPQPPRRTQWLTILDLPDAGLEVIERQVCDLLLEGVEIQVHDGRVLCVRQEDGRTGGWKDGTEVC